MQQLKVLTDLSTLPAEINSNYEAVKADLQKTLKKYDGLVVTDENIKEMKKTRAEINNGIKVIKQCGTDTKKLLMAPFLPFDEKVKELVSLAEEKAQALDRQIKEIEEKRRADKEKELKDYVAQKAAEILKDDLFTASKHVTGIVDRNPTWLNATTSVSSSKKAIDAEIERCADVVARVTEKYAGDYEVIKAKARRFIVECATPFDYGRVIDEVDRFKKEQEELAEARRKDEERRKAEEEARKAAQAAREAAAKADMERRSALPQGGQGAPVRIVSAAPAAQVEPAPAAAPAEQPVDPLLAQLKPTSYKMVLEFTATMPELKRLRSLLDAEKLTFRRIGDIVKAN